MRSKPLLLNSVQFRQRGCWSDRPESPTPVWSSPSPTTFQGCQIRVRQQGPTRGQGPHRRAPPPRPPGVLGVPFSASPHFGGRRTAATRRLCFPKNGLKIRVKSPPLDSGSLVALWNWVKTSKMCATHPSICLSVFPSIHLPTQLLCSGIDYIPHRCAGTSMTLPSSPFLLCILRGHFGSCLTRK